MKAQKPLAGLSLCAAVALVLLPAATRAQDGEIGIGGGSGHKASHVLFKHVPGDTISVSVRVRIDAVAPRGLNFFAIQVNFPNRTWAHGGLQQVNGKRQTNWGGLVNRGGGATDYKQSNPAADLMAMQNGADESRTQAFDWSENVDYVFKAERGREKVFPPGDYIFIGSGPVVHVEQPRKLWEWIFTIERADGQGKKIRAVLYDGADRISSFYIWNENGYGSRGDELSARWSAPVYSGLAEKTPKTATEWSYF